MAEREPKNQKQYRVRSSLPKYFRVLAVAAIFVTVYVVIAGFYRARSKSPFKLKTEHTQLSTDVTAEISSYERMESDNGIAKYYVKADHAKTFGDDHQELENVYLEVYDDEGKLNDKMSAQNALFVPEKDKNFTAYLKGSVQINTKEDLQVKTENLNYTRRTEIAESDEAVQFEHANIRGKTLGATVKLGEKRLDLLRDVDIEMFESPELAKSNILYASLNSSSATFDQLNRRIELFDNVAINLSSKAKSGNPLTTDVHAGRALLNLEGDSKSPQLRTMELFENVHVASTEQGMSPTNIETGYALFDKPADRYVLKNGAHIITATGGKQTDIKSSDAVFEQAAGKLVLNGDAEVSQAGEFVKGDTLNANLYQGNQIKDAVVRGNAFLKQVSAERALTVSAPQLDAAFGESRQMTKANATGESTAEILPADGSQYSKVSMNAGRGIAVFFRGEGLMNGISTDGRTTVQLNAANGSPDAANKRISADGVTTTFQDNGKDIRRTEAIGNAELYVEPLKKDKKNYLTTITAPRFECDFYPAGNNAKTCVAGKKAKVVRVPTTETEGHGQQTIWGDQLTALFNQQSKDVETLDADGNAKFTELDHNALAGRMTFTQADETLRLRGGDPTVWDSRGRGRSREIDIDTRNNKSYLRGAVSTTYYSQRQINNASPFGASDKPVFMTAETAEIDNAAQTAVYSGNARGWQENNFVRGDRIFIDQNSGRFVSEGHVQSMLYNVKTKQKGKESNLPTSASSGSMTYERDKRLIQYRNAVDIRQGTDRITSESADVYLNENDELSRTVAEKNVVITQPNRKATGEWIQYTAESEVAILRGSPAMVIDAENGTSQGSEMTFSMRDSRVVTEGKSKQNPTGRIRSVYKVKPQ